MHKNPQRIVIFPLRAKPSWPTLFPHARASGRAGRHSSKGFGPGNEGRAEPPGGPWGCRGQPSPSRFTVRRNRQGSLRAPVGVEDQGRPARLWPSGEVHRVRLRAGSVARSGTGKGAGFAGPRPGEVGLSLVRTLRRVFGPFGADDRAVPCGSCGPCRNARLSGWGFALSPIATRLRPARCRNGRMSVGSGFPAGAASWGFALRGLPKCRRRPPGVFVEAERFP